MKDPGKDGAYPAPFSPNSQSPALSKLNWDINRPIIFSHKSMTRHLAFLGRLTHLVAKCHFRCTRDRHEGGTDEAEQRRFSAQCRTPPPTTPPWGNECLKQLSVVKSDVVGFFDLYLISLPIMFIWVFCPVVPSKPRFDHITTYFDRGLVSFSISQRCQDGGRAA